MKLKVNQEACIGCGACFGNYEDLFKSNEDGLSAPKAEVVPEDKKEEAKEAAETCPTGAITVEE